jgi:hypothetical protein
MGMELSVHHAKHVLQIPSPATSVILAVQEIQLYALVHLAFMAMEITAAKVLV